MQPPDFLPGAWPRRRLLAGLAGFALIGSCGSQPDLTRGESGRVARVPDGDLLYLDTGQAVRLVEVEAPRAGRTPEPYGEASRDLLARTATGRQAQLYYGGLSRDRFDRALAHVIVIDEIGREVWLNGLMVRQGGARVRTYPDNARRARALLALEAEARNQSLGLWSLSDYRVLSPSDVLPPAGFAILEGGLVKVGDATGDSLVRLRPEGFELRLGPRLSAIDPGFGIAAGDRLRVRGRVDLRDPSGPTLPITHWEQVERIDA